MCTRRSTAPCLCGIDWQENITAFIVSGSVTDCLIGSQESTGSFSKVVLSQGAVNQVFLGVFLMFLSFSIVKYFNISFW